MHFHVSPRVPFSWSIDLLEKQMSCIVAMNVFFAEALRERGFILIPYQCYLLL